MGDLVKEIFIFALLFMVIMFTLGIIFYDYIPTSKSIPVPIEYTADSLVTSTLQEIAQNQDQTTSINVDMEPEWSYSITSSDLQAYASKKSYTSGKTDPFAEYVEEVTDDDGTNTATNTTNTASSSTNSTSSTTGTYFESSSSK